MAKFIQGASGTFSGKVGSVIGSSWRGINYIRGIGKKSKVPPTESQLLQRQKFLLMSKFLAPLQGILKVGFGNDRRLFSTSYGMAIKRNLVLGVLGDSLDNLVLNYPALLLSRGSLYPGSGFSLSSDEGLLTIGWNPAPNQFSGDSSDEAYIVVYNTEQELFITTDEVVQRVAGTATVDVPEDFDGQEGHAWLFFASKGRKQVSRTIYLGTVNF